MKLQDQVKKFPDSPGVYFMKNAAGEVIYVGKATSLKERVRSYFFSDLADKTMLQMAEAVEIDFKETETAIEALFLESEEIKKLSPKYNIKERDDKSKIYVYLTHEDYPRINLIRETDLQFLKEKKPILYGPFLSVNSVVNALELIRKVIPYRSCKKLAKKKCVYGYIGLCEAPCIGEVDKEQYKKNIKQIRDFFEGKKGRVLMSLKRDLKEASKKLEFERAAKLRDRINALEHLKQMFFFAKDNHLSAFRRIEGYDISNISGAFATGSMVVFIDSMSEKSEYRKFKIKSVVGSGDLAMMAEVIRRRFRNDWERPDLILIDGGRGQVNTVVSVLNKLKIEIPVIGLAKGPDRKKDELITSKTLPRKDMALFKQVRDEAHRFAKGYYTKLHRKSLR